MSAFVTAGSGFLLAVLWFDLMFDVQARKNASEALPEAVLASIAGYYARVTTAARPMNRLIAIIMAATVVAIVRQLIDDDQPIWPSWASLALILPAVGTAAARTVPNAVRLGKRADSPDTQSVLARAILRDHVLCFTLVASVLAVQLGWAA